MSESTRAYIYRILVAVGAVAIGLGYASESDVALYLGLAAAILGNTLAAANTSTKKEV